MWVQTNIHIYSYTLVLFYCFLVACFVISCSSLTHIVTCKTRTKLKKKKKKHNTTTEVKGGVEARRSRWGRYKESEDNEEGGGWNETRYKYVHSININYVYLLYLDEGYILVYYQ